MFSIQASITSINIDLKSSKAAKRPLSLSAIIFCIHDFRHFRPGFDNSISCVAVEYKKTIRWTSPPAPVESAAAAVRYSFVIRSVVAV